MGGEFNGQKFDVWYYSENECGVWDNTNKWKVQIASWNESIYAPSYEEAKQMARDMNAEYNKPTVFHV